MKVLFIGGTGNISKSVSTLSVSKGMELYLLNRGTTGITIPGVQVIKGDITKPEILKSKLNIHNWDCVVNWIAYNTADIERDIKLFKNITKQYIFISSASAYQKPLTYPVITESTPLSNPFWQYSRDKIACEQMLIEAFRSEGFPATIVRPSHTYDTIIPSSFGGGREYTLIDRMKKGKRVIIHGDGTSLWALTHSADFAKGFTGLIGNKHALGHAFHITSDELLNWNQIYEQIAEAAGVKADIIHIATDFLIKCDRMFEGTLKGDKSESVIFDNTKIKTFVPGFKADIPFSTGIKKTLAWFEEKPERMIIKPETNNLMDRIINLYSGNN
jgi:nucleoside-diphosphate-sugar epimerase